MAGERRSGRAGGVIPGLPLFRKELIEQAARPRTYRVRVYFAAILTAVFILYFIPLIRGFSDSPERLLGAGRWFLESVAYSMFVATYLLVPPLVAGAFPAERERGSLALLWLTGLRPTEILAEKFLGRVFPVLTLLLTSLPLLTIAYAFGGVTTDRLWSAYYLLFLACLQLGSIALFFSTALKSEIRAILFTYLTVFLLNVILPMIEYWMEAEPFILSPIGKFGVTSGSPPAEVVLESLPIALSALLFLVLGRSILMREFSPRTGPLERSEAGREFKDRASRVHRRFTALKGLPDREPVAWRARGGIFGGQFTTTLVAVFVLEGTVIAFFLASGGMETRGLLPLFVIIHWCVAVLAITLRGVNAVIQERTHQTLNVLLVTPLTGREILHQKWKGLRRTAVIIGLMMLPWILFHALHLLADASSQSRWAFRDTKPGPYLAASLLSMVIYMPLLAFFSLWIGLKAKTVVRASLTALFAVVLASILPFILMALFGTRDSYFGVLSPAATVILAEFGFRVMRIEPWTWIALNFTIYGSLLALLRALCLRGADRHFGRVE